MSIFVTSNVLQKHEEICRMLEAARISRNIGLDQAASDTKINRKYLIALESGDFGILPAGVYVKNYLKTYAEYLGLNSRGILYQYEAESRPINVKNRRLFVQKTTRARFFLSIPKALKIFSIILLVFVCLGYLGWYISNIISPPELVLIFPGGDIAVLDKKITIAGHTEKETGITVNGNEVLTDKNGSFSTEVILKTGVNTIQVIAKKKYSRPTELTRNILSK